MEQDDEGTASMGDGRLRRWRDRLAALLAAALLAAGGVVGLGSTAAHALGAGEVCVFDQPFGAAGLGHIGWGYLVGGTSTWVFGSTENPNGSQDIPAGSFNGAWHASGTKAQMVDAFEHQWYYPSTAKNSNSQSTAPVHAYQYYKCQTTATSSVGAANDAVAAVESGGYDLLPSYGPRGNCMDHAFRILSAYGAPNLSSPTLHPGPNSWYQSLGVWPNTGWNETTIWGETWFNPAAGKPMEVPGSSNSYGTQLQLYTYNGTFTQWWVRVDAGSGYYKIINRNSDECIDIDGPNSNNGSAAHQWGCYNTDSQLWSYQYKGYYVSGWPVYQLVNKYSGKCLDATAFGTADGTKLQQWSCSGGSNQEWY